MWLLYLIGMFVFVGVAAVLFAHTNSVDYYSRTWKHYLSFAYSFMFGFMAILCVVFFMASLIDGGV